MSIRLVPFIPILFLVLLGSNFLRKISDTFPIIFSSVFSRFSVLKETSFRVRIVLFGKASLKRNRKKIRIPIKSSTNPITVSGFESVGLLAGQTDKACM